MLPFPVNNILGSRSLLIADVDAVARVAVRAKGEIPDQRKFRKQGIESILRVWGLGMWGYIVDNVRSFDHIAEKIL